MKRSLTIALAVLILGSAAQTSVATEAQYPERYFMYWKPTFGSVQLDKDFLDPTKKTVFETFGWGTWVSMLRLDAPRTPTGDGMYEHEMRFNDEDGQGEWCTIDRGYNVIAKDLPSGAYHDDAEDPGEFTWGMNASLLIQDHVYDIKFRCWSSAPNSSEEFQSEARQVTAILRATSTRHILTRRLSPSQARSASRQVKMAAPRRSTSKRRSRAIPASRRAPIGGTYPTERRLGSVRLEAAHTTARAMCGCFRIPGHKGSSSSLSHRPLP